MKQKNVVRGIVTALTILLVLIIPTGSSSGQDAAPPPTPSSQQDIMGQVEQAIFEAIATHPNYAQGKMLTSIQVSDVLLSEDQLWSTAWVVYYDAQIEAIIPTEPALAVTHFTNNDWQVSLPSDPGWQDALYEAPEDLLTAEAKEMWATMNQGSPETQVAQGGYYLPWHGGQIAYLSRSVGHDADFSTAHFAFDFFLPGTTSCPSGGQTMNGITGLNFDLFAAKAGTVWGWDDSVTNCDHSKPNFIVLRNIDDPTTFQLYMHLAQGSIPAGLKTVGASVARGQFIAVADNTGISTGSHLHFQVERQPTWPSGNPYWNTALDITFDDVNINGGRPRSSYVDPGYCRDNDVCDTFRNTYTSNNYYLGDSTAPIGGLSGVTNGQTVTTGSLALSGWGADYQSGLAYGQLRAYFSGAWHNLGGQFNPNFSFTWDLCNPALPVDNGAVSVAMLLYDVAGNPAPAAGLQTFIKDYACPSPPPSCIPDSNQVALFEDPFYQGGCVKFNIGDYPTANSLNPLGNNDADSILVGDNVIATLYTEENFSGHSQSVNADLETVKYQWVSSDALSSMKINSSADIPAVPVLISPSGGTTFRQGDMIPISWLNGGRAIDYQVEISTTVLVRSIGWQTAPIVFVDSLPQGSYHWRVRGRNSNGTSGWSGLSTFSIGTSIPNPAEQSLPYIDTMETSQALWFGDGLWSYKNDSTKAYSGTHSWWYQNNLGNYANGLPNYGSLTSPPIWISNVGYYLRFFYRYQTETQDPKWDQRWVQISVDNGPFINLAQLTDDPQMPETSSWLNSKAIDLSQYVGHRIRVRFQFSTFDASANNFPGWGIDDFSITATPPQACSDTRQDDTPETASLLVYNPTLTMPGAICPNGDFDYYKFYGQPGDRIVADINALSDGSRLDAYLYLIDGDGKTVLAESDDEVYAQLRDPLLSYTLTRDGIYYLKLRAWKNPAVGGNDYNYSIRLYKDLGKPTASMISPASNIYLPDAPLSISANVTDETNSINRVEFYWHSTDWSQGEWRLINTDRTSADGWNYVYDLAGEPEGHNATVFVKAIDNAGNIAGAGAWNLSIDKAAPVTSMKPLVATQPSNAILLEWTAWDNLSGINFLEIQEKRNQADWVTLPRLNGSDLKHWIIADPGNTYAYRMHGVDFSGNSETYPTGAEATTTVPSAVVLCNSFDNYDTAGHDNTPANASTIVVDGASQVHNYCNPLTANYQNDEDWIKVDVVHDIRFNIRSHANSKETATIISLYDQDAATLIAEIMPDGFGESTYLSWIPDHDGTVYIRLRHLDGRVIGKLVSNTVSVTTGMTSYLPFIKR